MLTLLTLATVALALEADPKPNAPEPGRSVDVLAPAALVASATSPVDPQEAEAALAPLRARLREVLATETWYSGPRGPLVAPSEPVFTLLEPLLDAGSPRLELADGAIADRAREGDDDWWYSDLVRSNYKRLDEGGQRAVAFGIQRATQGRGISRTSVDLVVLYDDGRPTHAFASHTGSWGDVRETLYTFTTDEAGRILVVDELASSHRRTWTRS